MDLTNKLVLLLNIKKGPFEVMVTGEKNIEFREKSPWINNRLFNKSGNPKKFDYVKFVLGYGNDKPWFVCEFNGLKTIYEYEMVYSNGLHVKFDTERWGIMQGKVILTGNMEKLSNKG